MKTKRRHEILAELVRGDPTASTIKEIQKTPRPLPQELAAIHLPRTPIPNIDSQANETAANCFLAMPPATPGSSLSRYTVNERMVKAIELRREFLTSAKVVLETLKETGKVMTPGNAVARRVRRRAGEPTRREMTAAAKKLSEAHVEPRHWVTAIELGEKSIHGRQAKLKARIPPYNRSTISRTLKALGYPPKK